MGTITGTLAIELAWNKQKMYITPRELWQLQGFEIAPKFWSEICDFPTANI